MWKAVTIATSLLVSVPLAALGVASHWGAEAGASSDLAVPAASNPALPSASDQVTQFVSVTIPPDKLVGLLDSTSDFQRALLEDGELTFAEYQNGTFATIACFEAKGFSVQQGDSLSGGSPGARLTLRGRYDYAAVSPPHAEVTAYLKGVADCKGQYSSAVDMVWAERWAPSATDVQQARDAVATCLRNSGHDAPEHPTSRDLWQVAYPAGTQSSAPMPEWYLACAQTVSWELDLPGFVG